MRSLSLRVRWLSGVLALSCLAAGEAAAARTNFLIILADDVGSGDVGYACITNSTVCPKTPNLDAMAKSDHSVVFHRFYAGAGVCSPTRASVLTGRNNKRSCIDSALRCDHMNPAWSCSMGKGMARSEFTIANAVKASDPRFMTSHIGKWHLGDFWNKKTPDSEDGFCSPGNVGFDEWHSTEAQTATSVPNCGCFPPKDWTPPSPQPVFPDPPPHQFSHEMPGENCIVASGIYVNESFDCANYWFPSNDSSRLPRNLTEKITGDDGDYIVDVFDDFVARAVEQDRPFLTAMWTHYIHLPHPAMPSYYKAAVPSGDPDYIGALAQMDNMLGRVQNILRKHGVFNDTLVWFTSDNGPHCSNSPYLCSGPLGEGRSNSGLRGCKASIWEGGIRVPGVVQWPARIVSHREVHVPAVTHDILPTIMDLISVPSPHPAWPLDGMSLSAFFGPADGVPSRRPKPIGFWWGDSAAWIDNDVKVIGYKEGTISAGQGCIDEPPFDKEPPKSPMMFNLTESPTESENILASQGALYSKLAAQFAAWIASVDNSMANETMCSTPTPSPPPPPSPPPSPPPPPGQCTFIPDTMGFGRDGWKKSCDTKEHCCALCLADPKCTVAVFVGGFCHGKTPETKGGKPSPDAWTCRARSPPTPGAGVHASVEP